MGIVPFWGILAKNVCDGGIVGFNVTNAFSCIHSWKESGMKIDKIWGLSTSVFVFHVHI